MGPGPGSRTRVMHPTLDGGDGIWEGGLNRCLGTAPMGTHLAREDSLGTTCCRGAGPGGPVASKSRARRIASARVWGRSPQSN